MEQALCISKGILLVYLLTCAQIICAQGIRIQGTVRDESGEVLPGASIIEKGTTNGTITDVDGKYSIDVTSTAGALQFSYIGMNPQTIEINGRTEINISMEPDILSLNEVVVIGYGTATKKEITGSVATVNEKDFNKGVTSNPLALIQGKVPGLNIRKVQGGDPNSGYQIRLRGLNSLSGGKSPLIIVDGVIGSNALEMLDPNEIESIDVLKDGSAAAIYGTRATNGVILITTKKPQVGKVNFDISSSVSTQVAVEDDRYLSADEYRNVITDYYPDRTGLDAGGDTQWFDEVTRSPVSQYYSLSSTGGTENINFRANLYFNKNEGLIKNSDATTVTPSIVLRQSALDNKLNIDYRLSYTIVKRNGTNQGVANQAVRRNPTEPVFDPDDEVHGGYYTVLNSSGYLNPVAMLNERSNDIEHQFFSGDVNASYEIVDGLKVRLHGTYNSNQDYSGTYLTRYYPGLGTNGDATLSTTYVKNKLFEPDIEYDKEFNDHSLKVLAGYSYFENEYKQLYANNYNFDVDDFSYNNIGAGYALPDGLADLRSNKNSNKLIAFYGRIMYNFQEKYLLSASMRYEGSSRFGSNNKWGLFPAISAGWRINEENFASDWKWLNNLKLRAGFGVTGNQDIPNYQSIERLQVSSRQMYYNGQWINAYQPANNPNPDLKWEKKSEIDIGLDFGLFNERLSGTIDYYHRNISDLLWYYAVPVPPNVYETVYANVGTMENKGFEAQLNYNAFNNTDFSWTTSLNYSRNRNKLVSFSDPSRGYELENLKITPAASTWTQFIVEGQSVGNYMAPVFTGVDEDGEAIYKDVNGDGNVDVDSELDREVVGNEYPKFEIGWNNNLSYKKFDLSFFFRAVSGVSLLNYERLFYENWQPFFSGQNVIRTVLDNPEFTGIPKYDSRYVEKASYVKLDNVTLGFNTQIAHTSFRVFLSGQNLLTITDYSGADPEKAISDFETKTTVSGGENLNYYPYTKTFLLGVDLKF